MNSNEATTTELGRLIQRVNNNGFIPELKLWTSSNILRDTSHQIEELEIEYEAVFRMIRFCLGDYNFLQIYLDRKEFSMPVHVTKSLSILDRDKIIREMNQLGYNRVN